ncbi:hypothetical protein [Spongiimicrobium salis]|uniref:hypothetical protein n=1 Tax=Spongiimicrobium salis TaxID=1667022 RepID=UPI00374D6558
MKKQLLIACLLLLIGTSCKNEGKHKPVGTPNRSIKKKGKPVNLNISVLLDLSDRIDTIKNGNQTMHYYQRDLEYIQSISNAFIAHLELKKIRTMNDKIALFFDPEPKNRKINAISKNLKFHIIRKNATLEMFHKIRDSYQKLPKEIYEQAITDGKYIGSDTWRFFKNKVNDYCIEHGYRNILVILTDGYIYHKNTKIQEDNRTTFLTPQNIRKDKLNTAKWSDRFNQKDYGFIANNKDLSNLEVLVLGINPATKHPYEEDVIIAYWSKWLEEMNLKNFEIKQADLPSHMEKVIHNFVLKE